MSDFKRNLPPKTALNEYKLTLSCKPAEGSTKPGNLRFTVVSNQPRIDVYTNVPNDKNNGLIRAAMDAPTCYAMLDMMNGIINGPADNKVKINNLNHTWFDGKRSDEAKLISITHIGKDKRGVVYIAVTAKDRPFLKFNFLPSQYHALLNGDGTDMDVADVSCHYARGMMTLWSQLIANVLNSHYVEPQQKDAPANKPQQNRSNNSNTSNDWGDDDFPM